MHVSYRTVQSSRFQRGADGHVNRVCADGMRNETSCGEAAAVDGVQGSPPQAAGAKGQSQGPDGRQADIRTTVKQVDRKMGWQPRSDRVKLNSSYEMMDRLMGGTVIAGTGARHGCYILSLVWCVQ